MLPDKLIWPHAKDGEYVVKSSYYLAWPQRTLGPSPQELWFTHKRRFGTISFCLGLSTIYGKFVRMFFQ